MNEQREPRLSIVIPTHQRRDAVVTTARALIGQAAEVQVEWELIVVVDGSTDDSAAFLRELGRPVRVIEQEHAGAAAARNHGAEEARGEWLLFVDDDIVIQPGYLAAILRELDRGVDVVLSRLIVGDWVPDSLLGDEARGWDRGEYQALAAGRTRYDDMLFASTALRRRIFEDVGGFDESFTRGGVYGNEDVELGHRLLQVGARVRYCADAEAHSGVLLDVDLLMRREYQVGRNDVAMVRKHPELGAIRLGNKFRYSRMHWTLAPIMLRLPISVRLLAPLRAVARWIVRRDFRGGIAYRLWFTVRAMHYWRGVAEAGGRQMAREAKRSRGL